MVELLGLRFHQRFDFIHRVLFELADALGRHVVLRGEVVQRRFVVVQPALGQDVAAAVIQLFHRNVQAVGARLFPVVVFDAARRIIARVFEVEGRRLAGFFLIGIFSIVPFLRSFFFFLKPSRLINLRGNRKF